MSYIFVIWSCADVKLHASLFDMAEKTPTPGGALRTLRKIAGLTLKEVSNGADVSVAYLSKVERGEESPTEDYVGIVARYLAGNIAGKGKVNA